MAGARVKERAGAPLLHPDACRPGTFPRSADADARRDRGIGQYTVPGRLITAPARVIAEKSMR